MYLNLENLYYILNTKGMYSKIRRDIKSIDMELSIFVLDSKSYILDNSCNEKYLLMHKLKTPMYKANIQKTFRRGRAYTFLKPSCIQFAGRKSVKMKC